MKKLFYTVSVIACLLAAMSFTSENKMNVEGMYATQPGSPNHMQLNLKYDHTFMYQDLTNPDKQITVYGRWNDDGQYVTLKDYVTTFNLHYKWQITNSGNAVKARIGTTFYTLQKKPGC